MNFTFFFPRLLVHSVLLVIICASFAFGATTRLSEDEKQALKIIGKTLRKKDWDFNVDPCSRASGWITPAVDKYENNVTCGNCTTTVTGDEQICHVISISNLP